MVTVMVITAAPSWRLLPASALNTLTSLALAVTSVLHTVTSLTTSDLIRVFTQSCMIGLTDIMLQDWRPGASGRRWSRVHTEVKSRIFLLFKNIYV